MVLFINNVKKIKGAAHENRDIDGRSNRAIGLGVFMFHYDLFRPVGFIRRELLCELFSPCNQQKWVQDPLLNLSVQAKVDQIASVNAHALYKLFSE